MTQIEKAKIAKLTARQRALRVEIRALDSAWDTMDETARRRYDQHYGECVGIEQALAALGVPFDSVDDR